ncbi:MAG: hypothetical protein FWF71_03675 [Actinomycetia bacterium]|nr:hypothetical protein [Actinomycetes bacterium]
MSDKERLVEEAPGEVDANSIDSPNVAATDGLFDEEHYLDGNFVKKIDGQGRVLMPPEFRKFFEGKPLEMVRCSYDNCRFLKLMTKQSYLAWEESFFQEVGGFKQSDPAMFAKKAQLRLMKEPVAVDGFNRLRIPTALRDYLALKDDVTFIGLGDCVMVMTPNSADALLNGPEIRIEASAA